MTIEERLDHLERQGAEFKEVADNLRKTLALLSVAQQNQADVQLRQSEGQRRQAEILQSQAEIQRNQAETQKAQAESIARLFQAVDELSDKLNGVIGFPDNLPKRPPQDLPPSA